MYLPGDLIFCHGAGWLQRSIRWAERKSGEAASYANHVAGIVTECEVVEALWTVLDHPYAEALANTPHQVWRCLALTPAQRLAVAQAALDYVGREYGTLKIAAHLADALLSRLRGRDVYAVRRLCSMDRYPICSWVWAHAYAAVGLSFGVEPDAADPDDMHDYVTASPAWVLVAEIKEGGR